MLDLGEQSHGRQRPAVDFEEIVVHAQAANLENILPDRKQPPLLVTLGGGEGAGESEVGTLQQLAPRCGRRRLRAGQVSLFLQCSPYGPWNGPILAQIGIVGRADPWLNDGLGCRLGRSACW